MKKVIVLLALVFSITVSAQDKFSEGVVKFKQTMTSENEQVKAQLAMIGDMNSTTYFKGSKSRTELSNPMSGDIVTITNSETKETLSLMNNPMLGKKYNYEKVEDLEEYLKDATVTEGDETKEFLGYNCKQYFLTIVKDGVELKMEMFTTTSILASAQHTAMLGDKIKGFPLFVSIKMNQMGMDMIILSEATEVKKESVSNDKFNMTPPEGYTEMQK